MKALASLRASLWVGLCAGLLWIAAGAGACAAAPRLLSPALEEILRSDAAVDGARTGPEWITPQRPDLPRLQPEPLTPRRAYDFAGSRRMMLAGAYGGLYTGAAKVGARLGLEREFKVARLESAWIVDVFGHIYATRHISRGFAALHRWAGDDPLTARRRGAWYAAFGSLLYMEVINGFMPGVRFDWMDPLANGAGAWLADGGEDFGERHAWTRRLTYEVGYKSWRRVGRPDDQSGAFTRLWHDYPNMRFGVGYGIGPLERPWLRVFTTYGVTSFAIEELRNQFGVGIELAPHHWVAPLVERMPLGGRLLALIDGVDRHVMLPGLYIHLFDVETGPFTGREPFDEGR